MPTNNPNPNMQPIRPVTMPYTGKPYVQPVNRQIEAASERPAQAAPRVQPVNRQINEAAGEKPAQVMPFAQPNADLMRRPPQGRSADYTIKLNPRRQREVTIKLILD